MLMALAPGEIFQHTHVTQSITTLREGDVILEVDGNQEPLVPNRPTPVDALVTHTLINIGTVIAQVECGHETTDPTNA